MLILGYKNFGRGVDFFGYSGLGVLCSQNDLYNALPEIVNDEWYDVVAFDNLAIEQLDPKRLMSDEEWRKCFMGEDSEFSFYIDAVNKNFGKNSMSNKRYDMLDDAKKMFDIVRKRYDVRM